MSTLIKVVLLLYVVYFIAVFSIRIGIDYTKELREQRKRGKK